MEKTNTTNIAECPIESMACTRDKRERLVCSAKRQNNTLAGLKCSTRVNLNVLTVMFIYVYIRIIIKVVMQK